MNVVWTSFFSESTTTRSSKEGVQLRSNSKRTYLKAERQIPDIRYGQGRAGLDHLITSSKQFNTRNTRTR